MSEGLVLSVFPGIDGLGRGFEEEGFCVVRGPDVLWGGDVREFHPPPMVFAGVIGGDPCQAHMRLAHFNRALGREPRYPDMTPEFCRVVAEAEPVWFLRENVDGAPDPAVDRYQVQALKLNNRWLGGDQLRARWFWFGTREERRLVPEVALFESQTMEPAVLSGHGSVKMRVDRGGLPRTSRSIERAAVAARRPWSRLCELQGFPPEFLEDAPFTRDGRLRVLANAVPVPMARVLARAVKRALAEQAS